MIALLLAAILSAEPTAEQKAAAYARAEAAATAAERAELEKWLAGYDTMLRQARLARNGKALAWLEDQRKEKRARLAALKAGGKAAPRLDPLQLKVGAAGVPTFESGVDGSIVVVQVGGPNEMTVQCRYAVTVRESVGRPGAQYVRERVVGPRESDPFIIRGWPSTGFVDGARVEIDQPLIVTGTARVVVDLTPMTVFVLEPAPVSSPERVQPSP